MKKQRLWIATIMLLSLTSTAVFAGAQYRGEGDHQGIRFKRIQQELQLTGAQSTEMQALMNNHRTGLKPTREKARELRQEFRVLLQGETFDRERATQLAQEQAALKVDTMAARHVNHQQISEVLSPEQQARWDTLREDRKRHHKRDRQYGSGCIDKE